MINAPFLPPDHQVFTKYSITFKANICMKRLKISIVITEYQRGKTALAIFRFFLFFNVRSLVLNGNYCGIRALRFAVSIFYYIIYTIEDFVIWLN